eukprot:g2794.t1
MGKKKPGRPRRERAVFDQQPVCQHEFLDAENDGDFLAFKYQVCTLCNLVDMDSITDLMRLPHDNLGSPTPEK